MNCAILGLDDDQETLDLIAMFFNKAGIDNYKFFHNKHDFLKAFDETIHIAIIDHYLDGVSVGFDIMRRIFEINEENNALLRCKVIIISGQQDPKMIAYYLNKGAFRYIDKNDLKFFERLTEFSKIAIEEVRSFFESVARWRSRLDNINSILDSNERKTSNTNI